MRFGGSNRFRNRNKRANQLTGRRSRGGGQTLNLSAGASAQLLRLKQIAPKPAPMKIVRVPSNARPSSITATRVVIPPAPPTLPPPRVNPPPRKSKPAAEPDYNPPVVRTAVQITGNTIQRNLQPKAVYETPKPFNTRFIPPPGGNLSNSANNVFDKPITIDSISFVKLLFLPDTRTFVEFFTTSTFPNIVLLFPLFS